MNTNQRLDPLSFTGCLADLASDIPAELTVAAWRSQRNLAPPGGGAPLAAQGRTLRGRPRPRHRSGPSLRRTR